ncbi:hypothetical protein [Actinomyces qiguomingii]|uniref:hypothetical protein n=1 Tax=Actinomyces qiguomingii TaxID=2057800 RepID=UPI0011AF080C|nr:hypothetical protein [Actinomyces qiguomingii]
MPAPTTSASAHAGVVLEAEYADARMWVQVGPAAAHGGFTVVRLQIATDSPENIDLAGVFASSGDLLTMTQIYMLSLAQEQAYLELTLKSGVGRYGVVQGKPVELFPIFGAVGPNVREVEVFLPNLGIALGVPVVPSEEVDFPVTEIIDDAGLVHQYPLQTAPLPIGSLAIADDGSSDTAVLNDQTTVTLLSDLLFAEDSAEEPQLSGQADDMLAAVVKQVASFPSGGTVSVCGYSTKNFYYGDVDGAAAEAQAVAERLAELTDLKRWEVSAEGGDYRTPRINERSRLGLWLDDEARAHINRRVEVVLIPNDPTEGETSDSAAGDAAPQTTGPVATGAQGVAVTVGEWGTLTLSMERVIRVGGFLVGTVKLGVEQALGVDVYPRGAFLLPDVAQGAHWGDCLEHACNLTLLNGSVRQLPAEYWEPGGGNDYVPLTNYMSDYVLPADSVQIPVIWPDVGGDTVTLDLPGGTNCEGEAIAARLTDIPVVDG